MDAANVTTNARGSVLVLGLAVLLSTYQLWQPVAGFIPADILPTWLQLQGATFFRPAHLGWVF